MKTEISITKDYYQIRIPVSEVFDNPNIRKFLDFLRIKKIADKSEATEKDIEEISETIKENWWKNNGNRWLNEGSD
jgi:hypothetical protein